MKILILAPFLLLTIAATAQFNHCISLKATANFNAGQKELSYDNAGYGVSVDASLFSQHKLQALLETSINSFFGDKIYILANEGRENKNSDIYRTGLGIQYFIFRKLALSATAGPAWYAIKTKGFSMDMGYQLAITGFFGKNRRLVTKFKFTEIPKQVVNIQYVGLGLGYRFF